MKELIYDSAQLPTIKDAIDYAIDTDLLDADDLFILNHFYGGDIKADKDNLNMDKLELAFERANKDVFELQEQLRRLNDTDMMSDFECTEVKGQLVAIGSIGRWNGRQYGYKLLKSPDLSAIFELYGDYINDIEIYSDGYNLCVAAYHHDGTNYWTIREIKENYTGSNINKNNTYSVLPYVVDVMGYNIKCYKNTMAAYQRRMEGVNK